MRPLSVSDRDDFPWPSDELGPGVAAMLDDIVVAAEDAVGEPVVAHEPPDVLDRIELGRTWRQGDDGDIGGPAGLGRGVPAGPIHDQDGMGVRGNGARYLLGMERHGDAVAERRDQARH